MNAIKKIIAAGFVLELDGIDLVIEPFSKLTPNQLEFLKSHKAEIIQELKGYANHAPQQQQAGNDTNLKDGGYFHHEQPNANDTDTDLKDGLKISHDFDDRHYCHECRNLINHRCVVQRFKPTDDMPRRCSDFYGSYSL